MMKKSLLAASLAMFLAPQAWSQNSSGPTLTPRGAGLSSPASTHFSRATLTVPADTEATVTVLSGIHTRVSHVDDPVAAQLLNPVYVNGRIALPPGTLLDGHITRIRPAGRLHRPAELSFRFDRVTLPNGESEPVSAVLTALDFPGKDIHLDAEGTLRGSRGYSWKALTGGGLGLGAFSALRASVVGTALLKTAVPAGGAAFTAFEFLWPRGKEVNVPPQSRGRIRLDNPVTVRVQW